MRFIFFFISLIFSTGALQVFGYHPENPAGTFELDWSTDQINKTLAIGVFQTMGLRVDNNSARAGVKKEGNDQILYGVALAFGIQDNFAFDIDQDIKVELEINVTNLDHFYYTYDKNAFIDGLTKVEIDEGAKGWQKFQFTLKRARFANRGFGFTDFALSSDLDMSDVLLYIRNIQFEKIGNPKSYPVSGRLNLKITEAKSKKLIAAQVGLYDASGRMPLPSESAVELQFFEYKVRSVEIREELDQVNWPAENHYSMYVDGFYSAQIPAGKYQLILMRGPEYPIITKEITIKKGEVNEVSVSMSHELDMPAKGWYSGDVHNHFSRYNSYSNANQMAHARAADLHMHWLYALGNSVTTYFPQYAWGKEGQYQEQDYFLGSGQEDPRTDFLGHVLGMGQHEMVRYPQEYFHYNKVSKEIHEQGGIFGVAHMDFAQFQQKVALALMVPEDEIDFVEVFQYHTLNVNDWYAFLNLGFRLSAAAGSDWPYMSLPGAVRTYVKVNGEFNPESWNKGLKEGRSFVSNGPMMDFSIDGQEIGSVIKANAGQKVKVNARGYILPSWDKLSHAVVMANGEIIKEIKLEKGQEEIKLEFELPVETSQWLVFRVEGEKTHDIVFQEPRTKKIQAHSSPIYIEVDGQPTWSKEKGPELIDRLINRMEEVKTMPYQRNDNEAWESMDRTAELLEFFRPLLSEWIDEATAYYQKRKQSIEK